MVRAMAEEQAKIIDGIFLPLDVELSRLRGRRQSGDAEAEDEYVDSAYRLIADLQDIILAVGPDFSISRVQLLSDIAKKLTLVGRSPKNRKIELDLIVDTLEQVLFAAEYFLSNLPAESNARLAFENRLRIIVEETRSLITECLREQTRITSAEIDELRESAGAALAELQRLTERGGEISFASSFADYAKREYRRTWQLRLVASFFITVSIVVALLITTMVGKSFALYEIVRFLAVVPILLFAFYFIREASHHRDAAQAANEKAVRLLSVDAFTSSMKEEDRNKIRLELGLHVFGNSTYNTNPRTNTEAPAEMKDAVELVKAVGEVLRKQKSK